MGIENKFGLTQATCYFLAFVLSLFVCVPTGVNVDDFDGHCLLSTQGHWDRALAHNFILDISEWGTSSACNFTIFLGVVCFIISLFYCGWTCILLARGVQSTWLDAFINLIVNVIICICLFSTALTVSIGFQDWCQLLTQPGSGVQHCNDGQYVELGLPVQIHTSRFYTHWRMVEFGLWCSWIIWLVLSVMSLVRQYSFHRQETFVTSINRERQRLLQRVGHTPETA